jgi:hypothetical protein
MNSPVECVRDPRVGAKTSSLISHQQMPKRYFLELQVKLRISLPRMQKKKMQLPTAQTNKKVRWNGSRASRSFSVPAISFLCQEK